MTPMTAADREANAAASARVEAVLERLTRVQLGVVVVAPPDGERRRARETARSAAGPAGRGPLLDRALEAARTVALQSFARAGFSGTWAATEMAASVATASDRVSAAAAFEDAAAAAVVEDLVDDDTLDVLRSTLDELDRSSHLPAPGSLAGFTAPAATVARGPVGLSLVVLFVIAGVLVGVAFGLAFGLLVLAVGATIIGILARGRARSAP